MGTQQELSNEYQYGRVDLDVFQKSLHPKCHTLENNFEMKHEFAKYLKESCR